jgi:uncharacterized protein YndB with AHSA1/START domain
VIEPIRIAFEVACSVEHAFDTWARRIDLWWPADHTVSGEDDLTVVLEPHVGGRLFERRADGQEHDWGQVTAWEPPARLAYTWHLKRDRADATDVDIRFTALGPHRTQVAIEHAGWERLGADGVPWRDRNHGGWSSLLPHYQAAGQRGV